MNATKPRRFLSRILRRFLYRLQLLRMFGSHNRLRNHAPANLRLSLRITGRRNTIIVGPSTRGKLTIAIHGDCNRVLVGDSVCFDDLPTEISMRCSRATLRIGRGSTSQGSLFHFAEDRTSISVGRDCMLAGGTDIWATDFHSIIDCTTGRRTNRAEGIVIEDHVWIGWGARDLKNVRIGTGFIIGTGAVVTRDVLPHTISLGVPARVMKSGVAWDRRLL